MKFMSVTSLLNPSKDSHSTPQRYTPLQLFIPQLKLNYKMALGKKQSSDNTQGMCEADLQSLGSSTLC